MHTQAAILPMMKKLVTVVPPTTVILDQFTGSNGTALSSHAIAPTNTVSAVWASLGLPQYELLSNQCVPSAGASEHYNSLDTTIADRMEVELDFLSPGASDAFGIMIRQQDNNNTFLSFFIAQNANKIYSKASGAYTERASVDTTLMGITTGSAHKMRMTAWGQRIITDIDGVYTISYGSTLYQANTRVGLICNAGAVGQLVIDNYTVYQWPANGIKMLVCDGDSLTNGYGTTTGNDYPSQLYALLGGRSSGWIKFNFGVNGQRASQMVSTSGAKIDPLYAATHARNVCVVWAGVNDAHAGDPAATIYANLVTICQARQAAGWTVVICTMLNDKSGGGIEALRNAVNALIYANYATFADVIADLAGNPLIGGVNSPDDLTYFLPDKQHLNSAGAAVAAGIVNAAI